MALKIDYVARETGTNLWRNITLTIAAIVTIGVSLALFGSALVIGGGIDTLSSRWKDDVQIIAFLKRDITDEQIDALETTINEHPEVEDSWFMDQEESNDEFRQLFERNDAMLQRAEEDPALVPTSFRIVPNTADRQAIRSLTQTFREEAGVLEATSSVEGVEEIEQVTGSLRRAIFVASIGLLAAALLLILNAIRVAMFARRREIEVMKLVGATNWFIRVPFMMEGVVQGLLGSMLAVTCVKLLDRYMEQRAAFGSSGSLNILAGFVAPTGTVTMTILLVVFLGMVIGAVGSGIAIRRFLRI